MDFKQLQSFVTVVECQSFTKAARRLFVSQPTISAHVRALEEELQTALIIRTTKNIDVTPEGKTIYEDAVSILRIREHMLQSCADQEKRILRVAASTIPAAYVLPEILPAFGRLYPEYYFSIQRTENGDVVSGVSDGRYDLGFTTASAGGELMSLPVCRDRMVLITPVTPQFLKLMTSRTTTIEQLLAQPIILREKTADQKRSEQYLSQLGCDEQMLNVVARANDQETVRNLVAGGMGVSLISYRAARSYIEEKRVLCFEVPADTEREIYLVGRKADWKQDHLVRLAEFVRNNYAEHDAFD